MEEETNPPYEPVHEFVRKNGPCKIAAIRLDNRDARMTHSTARAMIVEGILTERDGRVSVTPGQ